jgi:hypothetical protein
MKWIQQYQEKPLIVTRVSYTYCKKQVSHPPSLNNEYSPLESLKMIFLGVIWYLSLIFFYDTGGIMIKI